MEVRPVDPRDVTHAFDLPAYRVYFWKKGTAPVGHPEDRVGYAAYEYELTACHNVREAIAWADENAGADRTYTLYAAVRIGDDPGSRASLRNRPNEAQGRAGAEVAGRGLPLSPQG
jgi:hypothetical protein